MTAPGGGPFHIYMRSLMQSKEPPKQDRIDFLLNMRPLVIAHMNARILDGDWHGASDDCNDLRELDAELRGLGGKVPH